MNPRVTVGLLAVLVALGAYVYFGPSPAPGATPAAGGLTGPGGAVGTPKPADPTLQLWQLDENQIQSVSVQRGAQIAGVQRAGEEWVLTPSGQPADRLRVNSVIFRLANVRATYRVANPGDDSEYGLSTPSLVATITTADGSTQTLTVGQKAPAESGTYARKAGDQSIYLISNALAQDLERLVTEPPVPPSPTPVASPSPAP
jgi:hypothetical protein